MTRPCGVSRHEPNIRHLAFTYERAVWGTAFRIFFRKIDVLERINEKIVESFWW